MGPRASKQDMTIAILEALAESGEPMGTRRARTVLEEHGISTSESSTSRLLRDTDEQGWTTPVGAKGRELTGEGRQYIESVIASRQTSEPRRHVVDVHHVQDLLDLLQARRAVESAAASNAALCATRDDLTELDRVVARHHQLVDDGEVSSSLGLAFHRKIAEMSDNRMLRPMTDMVLDPALDHVEAVLDIVLGDQRHEALAPSQHQQVVDAIRASDSQAAEEAMREHLTAMIREVKEYLHGINEPIFERLLAWVATQPGLRHENKPPFPGG